MPSYLVVGGSRGLGLETVRQLIANTNNTVFVTVRNKAGSTFLNELIAKSPSANIHVLEADVVDPPSLRAAAAEIAKITGGTLDNLIHNAARTEQTNAWLGLTDYESDEHLNTEFLEAFKVNVLGVIHSVNAFLPLLRQGSTKKITLIGTGGGIPEVVFRLRISSMAAYGTTKAAMEMVMTKYAVQLEHEGFIVISINPGVVDVSATKKQQRSAAGAEEAKQQMERMHATFTNFKLLDVEEGVKRVLDVVESVSPMDNGRFYPCYELRRDD